MNHQFVDTAMYLKLRLGKYYLGLDVRLGRKTEDPRAASGVQTIGLRLNCEDSKACTSA